MQTAGSFLSAQRREKGIKLEDIHQRTKITLVYLEAIENDQYQLLGGETYIRGFLRAYARALEIDPAAVMGIYDSSKKTQAQDTEIRSVIREVGERDEEGRKSAVTVLLNFIPREGWLLWTGVIVGAFLASYLVYGFISGLMPKQSFYYVRSQTEARQVVGIQDPMTTLQASAIEDVWVTLSMDDGPAKQIELKKGTRQVWRARKKFWLRVGNAGGLILLLNNKPVGVLGRSKEIVPSLTIDAATGKVSFADVPEALTKTAR